MGVFPNLFLDKVRPSIENLADNFKSYRLVAVSGDLVDETARTADVDAQHKAQDQAAAEPASGGVGH